MAGDGTFRDVETRVPLDKVVTTAELRRRAARPPNYEAENRALVSLLDELSGSGGNVLQKLVESALDLCGAHSAGISILEEENGREVFRWHAVAGKWSPFRGGTMPREASPCGTVVERNCSLLVSRPERHFLYEVEDAPPIVEALLIPFRVADEPAGTIWVIAHDETRRFDAEDERLMTHLGRFAATAHQLLALQGDQAAEIAERQQTEVALRTSERNLRQFNEELEQRDSARTEALRREHELNEAIINSAQNVILLLDTDGRVVRFNPYMEDLTGRRLAEVRGRDWFDAFVPERERERNRSLFARALRGERPRANVNPILTNDGGEREIEWYNAPLTGVDGRPAGLVCIGHDVTGRKQAESALKEGAERLRAILNTAVDAVVTIDRRGIIDSANPATERMFGYSREELIGRNVNMLMPSPYREEHDGFIAQYLETGEAKIIGIGREVEGRRKDGTVFPIDLAVSEIASFGLFTGIIRDITERKAEHERLLQAERLALLGEAMAGLTHESRNALARSQANLRRLARRLKGSEKLLQLIDGATQANEDIRRQFEEVREYAAPLKLKFQRIDLQQLVRQAWDQLADERRGRDARLRFPETNRDATCVVDPFSLRNAFRNILENALAASGDPVRIDIEFCEAQIDDRPALQIVIRDNGPGLPPEVAERAFDAFFTTKTKGTGLGLAIVKRTVEAHGGTVTSSSGKDCGAEIILTLPKEQP